MIKIRLSAVILALAILIIASFFWLTRISTTPWTSDFKLVFASSGILLFSFFLLSAYFLFQKSKIWIKGIGVLLTLPVGAIVLVSIIFISNSANAYTFLANAFLKAIPESKRGGMDAFPYSLTKEQWLADVRYLKDRLPSHHANLFLYLTEKEYDDAFTTLEQNVNNLSDQEMAWEVCRIISLIKDGHTQAISVPFNIPPFQDSRLFPLRIFRFDDGWYVTEADKDYKHLNGSKILGIGDRSIEEIVNKVSPFVPGENDNYKMQWAFPYLLNASLLKYLKIIPSAVEASFAFVNSKGEKFTQTLKPVLSPLYLRWFRSTRQLDDLSRLNRLSQAYWYEYNAARRSIFVQINQAASQDGFPTLQKFGAEIDSLILNNAVDRLIIDLRNCNGGDNSRLGPLVKLVKNPRINQSGKLFVLIGRQTFSGGVSLTAAIERNSKAIFIGESAGSGPNQCGDVQRLTLPNSKLIIQVSGRYHQQSYVNDRRLEITPTVSIKYSHGDWLLNIDPARAAAERYNVPPLVFPKIDVATLNAVTGRYKFDEEKVAEIKLEGNALWLEVSDFRSFARIELHQTGKLFATDIAHVTLTPLESVKGSTSDLLLTWAGRTDTLVSVSAAYRSPAELLMQGNYAEAVTAYREGSKRGFHFASFTEYAINRIGYELSEKGQVEMANQLFVLNSELFPSSGNVWDSLAESYLALNKRDLAKISCQRALELNPENENVRAMLNRL